MRSARQRGLRIVLSEEEHADIKETAEAVGMSMSKLLRQLGQGFEPKSKLDADRVREIIRARGDLNRIGGLLKLWLDERPGEGATKEDVAALVDQIAAISEEIRLKVRTL